MTNLVVGRVKTIQEASPAYQGEIDHLMGKLKWLYEIKPTSEEGIKEVERQVASVYKRKREIEAYGTNHSA